MERQRIPECSPVHMSALRTQESARSVAGKAEKGEDCIVSFAETFKAARKAAGLSLARLSARSGVSDGTISGWEKGALPQTTLPVLNASRAMGANTDNLFKALITDYERRHPAK